ncbi:nucleotidyltransferase domain-containing protein [Metallosphaera javensis (ex Sakai et al. 2022)]|uniref:nucleotidyltransferase domain-containing protein n=1 Tax=Metallosphaera javensis (ex Sakai et al. 2022) TaxID=2775498 RepID=UPI00258F4A75|nr:MAG: DNA polymerase [Metallosphaera javensis (ex Sakai et al. 2022)]
MSSWVRFKFEHLRRWREYAEKVNEAVKEVNKNAKVYVFGGVAEDRITVSSDIDILIIFPYPLTDKDRIELKKRIFNTAVEKYNLPFGAPVELHVVDEERAREYLRFAKKVIQIE